MAPSVTLAGLKPSVLSFSSAPSIFSLRRIATLLSTATTPVSSRAGGTEDTGTLRPTTFCVKSTNSFSKLTAYGTSGLDMSPAPPTQLTTHHTASTAPACSSFRVFPSLPSFFPSSQMLRTHTPDKVAHPDSCEPHPSLQSIASATPVHAPQTPLLTLSNPDKKSTSSSMRSSRTSTYKYLTGARFDSPICSATVSSETLHSLEIPRPPHAYHPSLTPITAPLRPHCLTKDRLCFWLPVLASSQE